MPGFQLFNLNGTTKGSGLGLNTGGHGFNQGHTPCGAACRIGNALIGADKFERLAAFKNSIVVLRRAVQGRLLAVA